MTSSDANPTADSPGLAASPAPGPWVQPQRQAPQPDAPSPVGSAPSAPLTSLGRSDWDHIVKRLNDDLQRLMREWSPHDPRRKGGMLITLASPRSGEPVVDAAAQLAWACARSLGGKTLLMLPRHIPHPDEPGGWYTQNLGELGWTDFVGGAATLPEVVRPGAHDAFDVVPSGRALHLAALHAGHWQAAIDQLTQAYLAVIMPAPTVDRRLAPFVRASHGVYFLLHRHFSQVDDIRRVGSQWQDIGGRILGCILSEQGKPLS